MTESPECPICAKHREFTSHTGSVLAEESGMVLSHFPIQAGAPATRGHLLIEPRRHVTDLTELSDEEARALGALALQGAQMLRRILAPEHVYVFRINDLVKHFHVHLIPRYPDTPREFYGQKIMEWPDRPRISLPEIHALSEQLRGSLK